MQGVLLYFSEHEVAGTTVNIGIRKIDQSTKFWLQDVNRCHVRQHVPNEVKKAMQY